MGATWWQKCWRWIVVMEVSVAATGGLLLVWLSAAYPVSVGTLKQPPGQLLAAGYLGMAAAIVALLALTLMVFTVPIWILVEVHGWWRDRRERRDWRSLNERERVHRR